MDDLQCLGTSLAADVRIMGMGCRAVAGNSNLPIALGLQSSESPFPVKVPTALDEKKY